MKLAWFTPYSHRSAIGQYSELIVSELARQHSVELFIPDFEQIRPATVPIHTITNRDENALCDYLQQFDLCIYNLGNFLDYHRGCFELSLRIPGISILHDLVMRDFMSGYCLARFGDLRRYFRMLETYYGQGGREYTRGLKSGKIIESVEDPSRLEMPLFEPMITRARGVVTHSNYSGNRVREFTALPLEVIDFPGLLGIEARPPKPRRGEPIRLLSFGHVNMNKLIHTVVEILGRNSKLANQIEYTIVGEAPANYLDQLLDLTHGYHLQDRIHFVGWKSDEELKQSLLDSHLVINLRNPHLGESSWSMLHAQFAGKPSIVWNHGYYAEFPDDCVCKVSSEEELESALESLILHPQRIEAMGIAALNHARERFDTRKYCDRFTRFANRVIEEKPFWSLTDRTTQYLHELGSVRRDSWMQRISEEIAEFSPRAA